MLTIKRESLQNDGIRYRHHLAQKTSEEQFFRSKIVIKPKALTQSGNQHLLFALSFILSVSLTVIVLEKILPEPHLIENERFHPEKFVAERAKAHVYNLTALGPRVAGSYENEVLAVQFLTNVINSITKNASQNHKITLDVTRHSGSFPLTFLDGMTHVYKNVQNVIVKIGPHRPSPYSLLLNCHFDSFVESPG